jgi:hypothetical protein
VSDSVNGRVCWGERFRVRPPYFRVMSRVVRLLMVSLVMRISLLSF